MGADLITAMFLADEKWAGQTPADLRPRVTAMIAQADPTTLEGLAADLDPWLEEIDAEDTAAWTDAIIGLTDDFLSSLDGRDVACHRIGAGTVAWFTGGMTWGDDPTEAWTAWTRFFPVCDALPGLAELVGIRFTLPDGQAAADQAR